LFPTRLDGLSDVGRWKEGVDGLKDDDSLFDLGFGLELGRFGRWSMVGFGVSGGRKRVASEEFRTKLRLMWLWRDDEE